MPRVIKEKQLPKAIEPAKWREQAETHVKKTLPKETVLGALRFIKRPEIEQAMKYLVVANSRQFERFDTDDGNGIDLCAIIRDCLEWGAYQPDPVADLAELRKRYEATDDKVSRRYIFNEVCELASLLANPKHGRTTAAGRNQLVLSLDFRLRMRLRGKPCYEAIALLVKATYEPSRECEIRKEAASVKKALDRMIGKSMIDVWEVGSDLVLLPSFEKILTSPK